LAFVPSAPLFKWASSIQLGSGLVGI
jgi:hypothetical protein